MKLSAVIFSLVLSLTSFADDWTVSTSTNYKDCLKEEISSQLADRGYTNFRVKDVSHRLTTYWYYVTLESRADSKRTYNGWIRAYFEEETEQEILWQYLDVKGRSCVQDKCVGWKCRIPTEEFDVNNPAFRVTSKSGADVTLIESDID